MTLDDIKRTNRSADGHYFDRDTMRYFRSRVSDRVHEGPGGVFIVTSERCVMSWRNYEGPRLYSVRRVMDGGAQIKTVGEFQCYKTSKSAHLHAASLASGNGVPT